jgi:hypothetical protein
MSTPNHRICIGTKAQSCHACKRKLKKEPFVRLDNIANGWHNNSNSINLCFKCVDAQHKDLHKSLKDKDILSDMLMYKL